MPTEIYVGAPHGRLCLIHEARPRGGDEKPFQECQELDMQGGVGEECPEEGREHLEVDDLCLWSPFPGPLSPISYEPTAFDKQTLIPQILQVL